MKPTPVQLALLHRLYDLSTAHSRLVEGPPQYANGLGGSNVAGPLRRGLVEWGAVPRTNLRTWSALEKRGWVTRCEQGVWVHWDPFIEEKL